MPASLQLYRPGQLLSAADLNQIITWLQGLVSADMMLAIRYVPNGIEFTVQPWVAADAADSDPGTLDGKVQASVEVDATAHKLQLVGDEDDPAAVDPTYYGTDDGGTKGFHAFPDPPAKESIEVNAGELHLVGDEADPGNSKFYGTNGAGARGWYDQPTIPAADDRKVMASSGDGSPDYLDGKVANSVVVATDKLQLDGDGAGSTGQLYGMRGETPAKGWYDFTAFLADLSGYDAGKLQFLANDHGTLKWVDADSDCT